MYTDNVIGYKKRGTVMNNTIKYRFLWDMAALFLGSQALIAERWEPSTIEEPSLVQRLFRSPATLIWLKGEFEPDESIDIQGIHQREGVIVQEQKEVAENYARYQGRKGPFEIKIDYGDLERQVIMQQKEGADQARKAMLLVTIIDELFYQDGIFFTDIFLKDLYDIVDTKNIAVRSAYLSAGVAAMHPYQGILQSDSEEGLVLSADGGVDKEGYLLFRGPVKGYFSTEMRKLNEAIGWKKKLESDLQQLRNMLLNYNTAPSNAQTLADQIRLMHKRITRVVHALDDIKTTGKKRSFEIAMSSDYYAPDSGTPFWLTPGAYNKFDSAQHDQLRVLWNEVTEKRHKGFVNALAWIDKLFSMVKNAATE
jgi:hypothetical protein